MKLRYIHKRIQTSAIGQVLFALLETTVTRKALNVWLSLSAQKNEENKNQVLLYTNLDFFMLL